MKSQHHEDGSSANWLPAFLVGLLFGGLAGAVAMWLLAPRAGEKTRFQIQKQGEKLREQATEGFEEVVTEAGDKIHQLTESVQKGVGELQKQTQSVLSMGKK